MERRITNEILSDLLSPEEHAAFVAADAHTNVQPHHHHSTANNEATASWLRRTQFTHTNDENPLHAKEETEQQASDLDGLQGGQRWTPPTTSPSDRPTDIPSMQPTLTPTYHPTPHGEPFVLKGIIWYDRNANGSRDSGISMTEFGSDVEYGMGLGGVKVRLMECNVDTNREIETDSSVLTTTVSQGYNAKMEPMVSMGGGIYRLVNIKLDKSYAVHVEAPPGYLFTSGICNDKERGWKCEYNRGNGRSLLKDPKSTAWFQQWFAKSSNARNLSTTANTHSKKSKEYAMGITSGRSSTCITVDRSGIPDKMLNFGVMRIGDSKSADADVALVLDFEDAVSTSGRRSLKEMIADATELTQDQDGTSVRRYLLGEKDKRTIGSVTAEVLAGQLDKRLSENQIVLDSVDPQDVILSDNTESASKEVAVALNIKGHYSPPPELDFEYIVNDSINSDTDQIRRDLKEFNKNCRDQMSLSNIQGGRIDNGMYSAVCAEGETLPPMFETSLKEISATKVSEIAFAPVVYLQEEEALARWAMGPVAAISGLITLLVGVFVFRRASPRKVDRYRQLQKIGLVDVGDTRRFGEFGGDFDDGSVDSAFYSSDDNDDDFVDSSTKDKEKKMRAKLRAEAEKSKRNGKSLKKLKSKKFGMSTKKLLVKSGGADDTDSLPSSNGAKEDVKKSAKKSSKNIGKDLRESTNTKKSSKSMRQSTTSTKTNGTVKSLSKSLSSSFTKSGDVSVTSEKKKSRKASKSEDLRASTRTNKSEGTRSSKKSRRGRDRTKGGDNARIVEDSKKDIV